MVPGLSSAKERRRKIDQPTSSRDPPNPESRGIVPTRPTAAAQNGLCSRLIGKEPGHPSPRFPPSSGAPAGFRDFDAFFLAYPEAPVIFE